jgi:hypothetical protein
MHSEIPQKISYSIQGFAWPEARSLTFSIIPRIRTLPKMTLVTPT